MKKIFPIVLLLATSVGGAVQAQSTNKTESVKPHTVETNCFDGNWFISAGAGTQLYFGDHNRQMKTSRLLSPALDIAAGKWLTRSIGIRLMYSGLSVKGVTQNKSHSNGEVYDAAQKLYKQKFDLTHIHVDMLFNLTNLLCGYNEQRLYSLTPYAGLGSMVTWDNPRTDEISACLGVLNTFRLSPRLDLNLDMRGATVNDRMDGETGGTKKEGTLSVTLGLSYKLGRINRSKANQGSMNEAELILLRQRLQAMTRANDSLLNLAHQPKQPVKDTMRIIVEKEKNIKQYEQVAVPYLVTFPLGKITLTKEIRVNLGFLAKVIKESSPTTIYTITGYADKGTGTSPLNDKLSLLRAHVVLNCLVEEHGVDPERLKAVAAGGVDNMFYNDPGLSRAVITQPKTDK